MRKSVWFLLASIYSITLLSGCNGNNSKYDEETNSQAKTIAAEYTDENYKNIKAIEMGDLYEAPMGSLTIDGAVNDGNSFSISFNKDISVSRISTGEGFVVQEACEEKDCDY